MNTTSMQPVGIVLPSRAIALFLCDGELAIIPEPKMVANYKLAPIVSGAIFFLGEHFGTIQYLSLIKISCQLQKELKIIASNFKKLQTFCLSKAEIII